MKTRIDKRNKNINLGNYRSEPVRYFYGGAKQDCMINGCVCKYLHYVKVKDMNGSDVKLLYCSCEDEICAGCSPEFL